MEIMQEDYNMVYKNIRWFSTALNIYMPTVKSILNYLKIDADEGGNYPITALNTVREFFETHDCKVFFNKVTAEKTKTNAIEELRKNPEIIILKDLIDYNNCAQHYRLIALFNNRNIKVYKVGAVAYIKKSDYEFLADAIDDIRNDISGCKSHPQQEITEYIKQVYKGNIVENDRRTIAPRELDIHIPDKHLAVELNGTYYHSSLVMKDKKYHLAKSEACRSRGIRLIHIFEYEWNDPKQREKIKLMLNIALGSLPNRIYARKCTIKQISNGEARPFNEENHLQGHRNAQITYGLFYKDELVQLMSFSKTRYNRNLIGENSWEIIRGCPGSNNVVIGGVSKLLKHFINDYDPDEIFSYCDFNKFDGRGYEKAGMSFIGYTGPDMKWVLGDMKTVVNRSPRKHSELKNASVAQIWGAGSLKYIWKKEKN